MYRIVQVKKRTAVTAGILAVALLLTGIGAGYTHAVSVGTAPSEEILLPVLMYHSVLEEEERQGKYVISPALLESDLRYLQEHGYTTVSIAQLLAYVDEGEPLPEKPVMLTFDDGYYNNFLFAFPLLRQYNSKAIISPIAYWSGFYSDNTAEQDHPLYSHLTWAQIRQMTDSGLVEIGNHSYHMHECTAGKRKGTAIMSGESVSDYQRVLSADLTMAQQKLTEACGTAPAVFVYPFGELCKTAVPVLEMLGFRVTMTCEERMNRITRDPACLIKMGRYLRPGGEDTVTFFAGLLPKGS